MVFFHYFFSKCKQQFLYLSLSGGWWWLTSCQTFPERHSSTHVEYLSEIRFKDSGFSPPLHSSIHLCSHVALEKLHWKDEPNIWRPFKTPPLIPKCLICNFWLYTCPGFEFRFKNLRILGSKVTGRGRRCLMCGVSGMSSRIFAEVWYQHQLDPKSEPVSEVKG